MPIGPDFGFFQHKMANRTFDHLASRQTGRYNYQLEHTEAEMGAQRIIDSGSLWQRLKARFRKKKNEEK